MQAAAAEALGLEPDQVGVASTGVIGRELPREPAGRRGRAPPATRSAADADDFSRGDHDQRQRAQARLPRGRPRRPARVRLAAQAKGAGMISPRFATMFCFVADRRGAGAGDARPAHRRVRQALVRPHQRGRAALHERHRVRAGERALRACAVEPETEDELRFGEALDALLRQLALEIVADGEGARAGRPGGGARRARRGRAGGPRGGQLPAREDRAARRRPQLRPHPAGRRPGLAAGRAVRGRPRDRGPPGGVGGRASVEPRRAAERRRAVQRTRSSTS